MIDAMGFFSSLFGYSNGNEGGNGNDRYVNEESFRENLARQTAMSPQTVAKLREYDVNDATTLKLEFFFYTDTDAKAHALAIPLRERTYEVETGPSAGVDKLSLVTGWTVPIKMDDRSVVQWVEEMCYLGYEHDCEFDGWGTNPRQ